MLLKVNRNSGLLVFGFLLLGGCFSLDQPLRPLPSEDPLHGIASWYGPSFHGKPTANGESFDMWAATAAHRTLPFGTWVEVQDLATRKTVVVRINDRGPFIEGRTIDLSYAAARELAIIGKGTAHVVLTIINQPQTTLPNSHETIQEYWIQAGSFRMLTDAMVLRERLAKEFSNVRVTTADLPTGTWHRVQVGTFPSKATANAAKRRLQEEFDIEASAPLSN